MPNDVLTEEQVSHFPLRLEGTVGYAAECLMDFQNLGINPRSKLFRIVEVKCGSPFPFRCCVADYPKAEGDFSFFLPACQVAAFCDEPEEKEPKARPFTIAEFRQRFYPPCVVCYRLKDRHGAICSPVIVGQITAYKYIPDDDDSLEITLSGMSSAVPLKARWLFDHVEWSPAGDLVDWRPFGVEEV
jgi:hypothetical protein